TACPPLEGLSSPDLAEEVDRSMMRVWCCCSHPVSETETAIAIASKNSSQTPWLQLCIRLTHESQALKTQTRPTRDWPRPISQRSHSAAPARRTRCVGQTAGNFPVGRDPPTARGIGQAEALTSESAMSFLELRGRSWGDGLGGFPETPRFRPCVTP